MANFHARTEDVCLNAFYGIKFKYSALTFDISQAITEGSFETRSNEKTLFFTFFERRASPVIKFEGEKKMRKMEK